MGVKLVLLIVLVVCLSGVQTSASVLEAAIHSRTAVTVKVKATEVPRATQPPRSKVPSVAAAQRWARKQLGAAQYGCLWKLFQRESRWNPRALNRNSGAYGIPQALPGSKMASAGADWRTNPLTQVRWGLRYIKARYGTACRALQHAYNTGWY